MNKEVKGFKVFNADWTCRGFQYKVGETYEHDGEIGMCYSGFHFCQKAVDCFNYYSFDSTNKVAEVVATGKVIEEGDKCCTNRIMIVRELNWHEVLELVNSGNRNSGNWNSGCFNTKEHYIKLFDRDSNWTYEVWSDSIACDLLNDIELSELKWTSSAEMTDEEKEANPAHKTTGGYLKKQNKKETAQAWWNNLSERSKREIKSIPNFDAEIFEQCTGIKVD